MQNFVQRFIWWFFVLIAMYHVIVTVLWYWILWWNSQIYISIARDALWILLFLIVFFLNIKEISKYLIKWKNVRIWFIVLIAFSILVSFLMWSSIENMMIGIKYWFFYLFIFLSASLIWFFWIKKLNKVHIHRFQYFLIWLVVFWFVWQIMKMIRPELFINIWYWKFDDFYFWANPPLYYLTWFEWTTRWQWLFSWPNNYGYFLVAFLPIILLWRNTWLKKLKNIFKNPIKNLNFLLIAIRILAIIMTLSRAAIIWLVLIFALLSKDRIKKNRKNKNIFIWILWFILLWIIWLSALKRDSTLWHINAKLAYIWEIIDNPIWHWLGTSWPAIHHNWTMLPENYFMQIMLDIWTVWFIFWSIVVFQILIIFKNIRLYFKQNKIKSDEQIGFLHWNSLYIWRSTLLVIWLFLHVFEDSMVNYLFFISFGLISWYLSKLYKISNTNKIKFKDLFVKQK